jgi:hypothetical protein
MSAKKNKIITMMVIILKKIDPSAIILWIVLYLDGV